MERTSVGFRIAVLTSMYITAACIISVPSCQPVEQELQIKVETGTIGEVGYDFALVNGKVVDVGDGGLDQHGFCFSTTENPTIVNNNTQLGDLSKAGDFSDSLLNLQSGTKYYVKAYALASDEIFYGDQISFTTLTPTSPVVAIESVGEYENDSVEVNSTVTDDGGSVITARGVCWSLEEAPVASGDHTTDGSGTGSFTSVITGLDPDTVYYIRAYATSAVATSYSDQHQVVTPAGSFSVTTAAITGITMTSAVSGGTIVNEGGPAVTARGVCWSTDMNPDISGDKTSDGTGTGTFTSSLTGLSPSTTYYVRAYATHASGTYYGNQVSFTTTSQSASQPVVTTTAVSSITETSAVSGGNITDDGGSSIVARGVCWDTAHDPDLSDGFTTDGTGTGSFTSALTGLASNTTYYVRAYATNGKGTSYGSEVSFTTPASVYLPTLTTNEATSITENSAVGGGNITDNGGSAVTAYGVCWSTSSDPEVTDNHTTDGAGSASFTSTITGLSPSTTYYVRAYATNSKGTGYGNEITFTTSSSQYYPTLTTVPVSEIATASARSGGNITDDGGSMVIERGVCWSTSPIPEIDSDKTMDGAGSGSFTSRMLGLDPNTTYYVRAYATNSVGTSYGNELSFTTLEMGESVTDIDGNIYPSVVIGSQTWMAKNLQTTHYRNGDPIPQITDQLDWTATDEGAFCYYSNDYVTYGETYGALYNWLTVDDSRGLCPAGWHVPTADEWDTLSLFVGGYDVAGAKLKDPEQFGAGTATNEYGFSAFPGGFRSESGSFNDLNQAGFWWTATGNIYSGTGRIMWYYYLKIVNSYEDSGRGYSIRCVKD